MIHLRKGNLFEAPAEALVNAVNTVGIMGKGIALLFKNRFPENEKAYSLACYEGNVRIGEMFVTECPNTERTRWIINFPTKQHWRNPSKLEWVRDGLSGLKKVINEKRIRSIAIPALGCGNGGLDWADVRPIIEEAMREFSDVDVYVFEPNDVK